MISLASVGTTLRVPDIMSSGMVLQQQTEVNLWGYSTSSEKIAVYVDWQTEPVTAKRMNDSLFVARVHTPMASFLPHIIRFAQGCDTIQIDNVLIGEVWFASGQSNMEMPLHGFWNCPVNSNQEEIAASAEWAQRIRIATIPKTGATELCEEVCGKWQIPSPATSPWMSAVAWHFAQMMTRALDCPIGVIVCAWGGSSVEGWTPRETLLGYKDIQLEKELKNGWNGAYWEYYTPMIMFNGMLHPLRHYTIKGLLWYQGEANVGKPGDYAQRLATMVNIWRTEFGDSDNVLPFYQTEIAPWAGYGEGLSAPILRDAQHRATRIIPNSGCVCTNDLVTIDEINQIHPAEKRQVGYRLAYMALNRTYGMKQIACDAPEYEHHEVHGKEVEVFFRYAENGLSPWQNIQGFELSGEDGVFYPASARINEAHRNLIVWSDAVPAPLHVRYCYKSFEIGNVKNTRNLPLVPFSTLSISQEPQGLNDVFVTDTTTIQIIQSAINK